MGYYLGGKAPIGCSQVKFKIHLINSGTKISEMLGVYYGVSECSLEYECRGDSSPAGRSDESARR